MLIVSLSYSKFETFHLQREESAAKSNVSTVERCFAFYRCWVHRHCRYIQIACNPSCW